MSQARGRSRGTHAAAGSSEGAAGGPVRGSLAFLGLAAGLVALSWSSSVEREPDVLPAPVPQAVPLPPSLAPAQEADRGSIPVRVTFVDALTGEPMPSVRWKRRSPLEPSDLYAPGDAGWHRSGAAGLLPPPFDEITIDPPRGYVALPPRLMPSFPIPRARAAALIVPLDREAIVSLAPSLADPGERFLFTVTEGEVGGVPLSSAVVQVGDRLRGIPFRRGAPIRLVLTFGEGAPGPWCGTGRIEEEGGGAPELEWLGRMGEDATTPLVVDPVLPRGSTEYALPEGAPDGWEEGPLFEPGDLTPGGGVVDLTVRRTVRVRLLDRSGSPARGVRVAVRSVKGRTDRDGAVTLEGVPGGDHFLRVLDEGWLFPPTPVRVAAADDSEVVARELVGGEVAVRVQDPDGNPLPFAVLAFRRDDGRSIWDLDDEGVRRLDPYVDAEGRRVLRHLPPGALAVRAIAGIRTGQAHVEIVDGGRHVVAITVPATAMR